MGKIFEVAPRACSLKLPWDTNKTKRFKWSIISAMETVFCCGNYSCRCKLIADFNVTTNKNTLLCRTKLDLIKVATFCCSEGKLSIVWGNLVSTLTNTVATLTIKCRMTWLLFLRLFSQRRCMICSSWNTFTVTMCDIITHKIRYALRIRTGLNEKQISGYA